jgi:outer membrane immunogenic protein
MLHGRGIVPSLVMAFAAFAGPVFAADMPLKAPPVVPVWSWTGCYAGVNVGYAWNSGRTHYDDPNTTADPINFRQPGFNYIPTPSDTRGRGAVGGFGAGCNWQNQQWVFGIEGDVDVGHLARTDTNTIVPAPGQAIQIGTIFLFNGGLTGTASESAEINWLSSIRARAGFTPVDRLLLFVTGGLAVGQVHSEGSVFVQNIGGNALWSGSNSQIKVGYVVGGGGEFAFADRWTAKLEYLYYNLGNASHPLNCVNGNVPAFAATCATPPQIFSTLGSGVAALHVNVVRVGLNYRFN